MGWRGGSKDDAEDRLGKPESWLVGADVGGATGSAVQLALGRVLSPGERERAGGKAQVGENLGGHS